MHVIVFNALHWLEVLDNNGYNDPPFHVTVAARVDPNNPLQALTLCSDNALSQRIEGA